MTGSPPTEAAIPAPAGPGEEAYRRGNALMAADDAAGAEAAYRAALAVRPDHAGALNNLGNALRAQGRHEEAVASYQAALAARPDYFGTLNNLGAALLAVRRPDAAEAALRRAVAANPSYAEGCNNLGGALLALDRPREAAAWFRRAVRLDPAHAQARFGEALALLAQGEYRAGWRAYEARWDDPRFTEDVPDYATPIWRGGPVPPRARMLLHAEQGLGDTIQFARYVTMVRARGAVAVLQVPHALVPVLAPLADETIGQSRTARDDPVPPHALRCPLMSLPLAFGTRLATIPAKVPYIHPDPARLAAWRGLGEPTAPRVGIAFSGSADHPDDALRSLPAAALAAALPGAELHVVQTDIGEADAAALAAMPAVAVHSTALTDFAETAALLACLDLVVSVDTSVAHLAGAMARPVWILLQHASDFRWLRGRADSPWYPTARLFRQERAGDWPSVLAAVTAAWHAQSAA